MPDSHEGHEIRIVALEGHVSNLRIAVSNLASAVQTNTEVTREIKADTAEMVSLLKGGKIFGKVVAWAAGLAAGSAGLWTYFKGH
jgi:hypothetical protein